ncbi:hypothetical protein [uncultured Aquimarina sp.]|uniref:hypothetical protein n=1 Tax=uncultured Aquimarina sp. TaxID=575652 RepID=UPI00262F74E5|nr:hypothetical protein [uncultured Aquimarina sp.]
MQLVKVNKEDFKIYNCDNEETEFEYNNFKYKLRLADLAEIGMSNYIYFDVKFFKENKLLMSGEMQLPDKYYNPISPNKKFIYIPIKGGSELINLDSEKKIESSVSWFNGNIYNSDSSKMIINGSTEFKVIDLIEMKEIYHSNSEKEYLNDAFFINNDIIWRFLTNGKIEELNLQTKGIRLISMELPFEKYNIELSRYQSLIVEKTHCLGLPNGGMAYSGNLNSWSYLNTKDKLVFETLIPTSDIKYSKNYNRDYCLVEYKYVELISTVANNV